MPKSALNIGYIILLALLALRFLGQIAFAALSFPDIVSSIVYLIVGIVYLSSIVGIYSKKKWGYYVAIAIGAFDLISSLIVFEFISTIFAAAVDLIIIYLAYKGQMKLKKKK